MWAYTSWAYSGGWNYLAQSYSVCPALEEDFTSCSLSLNSQFTNRQLSRLTPHQSNLTIRFYAPSLILSSSCCCCYNSLVYIRFHLFASRAEWRRLGLCHCTGMCCYPIIALSFWFSLFRSLSTSQLLSRKDKATFDRLDYLMSKEDNYKRLRDFISSQSMVSCIPYLGNRHKHTRHDLRRMHWDTLLPASYLYGLFLGQSKDKSSGYYEMSCLCTCVCCHYLMDYSALQLSVRHAVSSVSSSLSASFNKLLVVSTVASQFVPFSFVFLCSLFALLLWIEECQT